MLEAADELGLPANAPAVRQLSEYSETIRHLWDHGLPPGVDFTTIGGSEDLLVPADHIDVPGAKKAVVDVGGITPTDDHSGIGADPDALRAMRSALEGRAVPCTDLLDGIREAVVPVLTSRGEVRAGRRLRRLRTRRPICSRHDGDDITFICGDVRRRSLSAMCSNSSW